MKTNLSTRWLGFLALGFVMLSGILAPKKAEANINRGVSFQIFYDELAPYGDWVRDARHGYIWLPAVEQGFHPYGTQGHWVMTEFGNTWVSYYDWGWAPFHYGRWYFDDYFQSWAWVPGYEWGPAWVNWRTGGGYYGWAPLGPGAFINVRINLPAFHWVFLPRHRIYHQYAYRYYAPHSYRVRIYNNTTIINNTYVYNNQTYVTGPSRQELRRVTGRNVPVYQVRNSNAPGRTSVSRNALNVYRPEIQSSRNSSANSRPSRVLEADQAKSARGSRELNATGPSRNATMGTSSPSRASQSGAEVSTGRTAPSRATSPSVNQGSQRPVVTPMPNESRSRSTAPTQVQRSETRQSAPARSSEVRTSPTVNQRTAAPASRPATEVKRTETRTQAPAPNRGSVQQSRPAQAPTRTQAPARTESQRSSAPQVRSSAPARTQAPAPARTQSSGPSSSEVKTSAPARKEAPAAAPSRSSSAPTRSGGRNN